MYSWYFSLIDSKINILGDGSIKHATGMRKLIQNFMFALRTKTIYKNLVGAKDNDSIDLLKSVIGSAASFVMQTQASVGNKTLSETLQKIVLASAFLSTNDRTNLVYSMEFTNAAGEVYKTPMISV